MVDVLGDAGLRLEQAGDEDEARRDFMFLRAFRKGVNGTAAKSAGSLSPLSVAFYSGWSTRD